MKPLFLVALCIFFVSALPGCHVKGPSVKLDAPHVHVDGKAHGKHKAKPKHHCGHGPGKKKHC